jgi:hypothetical protein
MSGFNLPNNYTDNPEALLRKNMSHASSSSATPPVVKSFTPCTIHYYHHGQITSRLLHPRCCQCVHWARCQHQDQKL